MHEARTKNNWHISTTQKKVRTENLFIELDGDKKKVLRTVLFYRIKEYTKNYCQELKGDTKDSNKLRRLFARKTDHLFEIEESEKSGYEWWEDHD